MRAMRGACASQGCRCWFSKLVGGPVHVRGHPPWRVLPRRRDQRRCVSPTGQPRPTVSWKACSASSISSSCLRISPGVDSPMTFCRNGVWSKTMSRDGCERRAGRGGTAGPRKYAVCDCRAVCGRRGASKSCKCLAHRGVVGEVEAGEPPAEVVAVLGGHAGAVGGVGRGGVGGVADDGDAALRPLLERFAVADHPSLDVGRLRWRRPARQRVRRTSAASAVAVW